MAILSLQRVLHLGLIDSDVFGKFQQNRTSYFKKYHNRFWWSFKNQTKRRQQFRGEGLNEWVEPKAIPGNDIKSLQTFLRDRGFMPGARIDGIFGYWTLASVRLFQEYIRTVEKIPGIGIPDGRVGKGTHAHMMRWEEEDLYCHWGPDRNAPADDPFLWSSSSEEHGLWLELMGQVKEHYEKELSIHGSDPDRLDLFQLNEVNNFPTTSDSVKISKWTFKPNDIHLLGLRCFQERDESTRGNDDLFILLMNGMVFKFWGSTDPKPNRTTSDGFEPYLVEGQHKYEFSWHKIGYTSVKKVYKALIPASKGVLVFRDWSSTDALDEEDIRKGLLYNKYGAANRKNPNSSIHIHWTADGRSNWSAGCQVISGRSYINDQGELVDCSTFSAATYDSVSPVSRPGVRRNRGAYTFLSDFVFAYSSPSQKEVLYTLGRDGILEDFADLKLLKTLNNQIPASPLLPGELKGEKVVHEMVSALTERRKGSLV